jgi:hypothetical protein
MSIDKNNDIIVLAESNSNDEVFQTNFNNSNTHTWILKIDSQNGQIINKKCLNNTFGGYFLTNTILHESHGYTIFKYLNSDNLFDQCQGYNIIQLDTNFNFLQSDYLPFFDAYYYGGYLGVPIIIKKENNSLTFASQLYTINHLYYGIPEKKVHFGVYQIPLKDYNTRNIIDTTVCESISSVEIFNKTLTKSKPIDSLVISKYKCIDTTYILRANFQTKPEEKNINFNVCPGDSVLFKNSWFKSGDNKKIYVINGQNLCDSVFNVMASSVNNSVQYLNYTLCQNDSIVINGNVYSFDNKNGIDTLKHAAINGCDSIIFISLSFNERHISTINREICDGDTISIAGKIYYSTIIDTIHLQSIHGCDSMLVINIFKRDKSFNNINATICRDDTLWVNNEKYYFQKSSGTIILQNMAGCDSIISVNLNFYPVTSTSQYFDLCSSDTLKIYGDKFYKGKEQGEIIIKDANINGCDSIYYIKVNLIPQIIIDTIVSLCLGDTALLYGKYFFKEGEESFFLPNTISDLCDTVVQVNIINKSITVLNIRDTLCEGQTFLYNNYVLDKANPKLELMVPNLDNSLCDTLVKVDIHFIPYYSEDTITVELNKGISKKLDWVVPPDFKTILWNDPNHILTCAECFNPDILASEDQIITGKLFNDLGCSKNIVIKVKVLPSKFQILCSNVGSINGFNTINCFIENDNIYINSLQIYDRWGNLIYQNQGDEVLRKLYYFDLNELNLFSTSVYTCKLTYIEENQKKSHYFTYTLLK